MRTVGWEMAPQMALRNCSKDAGWGWSVYIFGFGEEGIYIIKHIFFQKVSASLVKLSASHKKQLSP